MIWISRKYNLFPEIFKFRDFKITFMNLAKSIIAHISRNKLYILILHITCFKMIYNMFKFQEFEIFFELHKLS